MTNDDKLIFFARFFASGRLVIIFWWMSACKGLALASLLSGRGIIVSLKQTLLDGSYSFFDYGVLTQWQPVESQRLFMWAGRYGKQEEFMTNLNHRHFEKKLSASERSNLLDAAEEVGLNRKAAN